MFDSNNQKTKLMAVMAINEASPKPFRDLPELQLSKSQSEMTLLNPFQYVPAIPFCMAAGKKSLLKGAQPLTVTALPRTEMSFDQ